MNIKLLKYILTYVLLLVVLLNCITTFGAEEINLNIETEYYNPDIYNFDNVTDDIMETNYICNASVNDDFEDDSVIVVFNNSTSLKCNEFEKSDFPDINIYSIVQSNFNKAFGIKVKEYLACKENETTALKYLNLDDEISICDNTNDNNLELVEAYELIGDIDENDIKNYNQCIKINLDSHNKQNVIDVVKKLEQRDDVLIAQPNFYYEDCILPNDTKLNLQNDIINLLDLDKAWNLTTGTKNVKVGILDSGIKRAHSDLTANVDQTLKFARDGVNAHTDLDGHGTQIAGIIGAVGNNNRGISGVCWNVDLVSLNNHDSNGEISDFAISNAFDYAIQNDIDIINCSFGSYVYDNYLYDKIKQFNGLVVCASGNDNNNNDTNNYYPSDYNLDNIISVAATDNNDKKAVFSNYGKSSVDLAAPGVDITTTDIGDEPSHYYTEIASGTSFSAPFVSGAAALIKSIYPTMTNNGVKKAILDGVDKCTTLNGKVKTGGRLNAYNSLISAKEHKFTVVYNKNNGNGNTMSNTIVTYGVPTQLSKNTYTPNSQYTTFAGWYAYRSSDGKWLYSKGGNSGWYKEGEQPSGYVKSLYKDQATISATSYTKNDVITMYAQWRHYQYQITYKSNGGTGEMKSQIVAYNKSTNLLSNTFLKTGYRFIGWSAKRKSDGKVYFTNGSQSDWYNVSVKPDGYEKYVFSDRDVVSGLSNIDNDQISMIAQWTPLTYVLEFDKNGGSGSMEAITSYSDQVINLPSHNFTNTGYCFNGWCVVDQDEYWLYTNGASTNWYCENLQPSGYTKVKYEDKDEFSYLADYEGIKVTLVAQWMPTYLIKTGDVNLDGVLSVEDVTLIQKYVMSLIDFNDVQMYAADVDKNGLVNVSDATALQKMLNKY